MAVNNLGREVAKEIVNWAESDTLLMKSTVYWTAWSEKNDLHSYILLSSYVIIKY